MLRPAATALEVLLLLGAGLALGWAIVEPHLWWLGQVCLVPYLIVLRNHTSKKAHLLGLCFMAFCGILVVAAGIAQSSLIWACVVALVGALMYLPLGWLLHWHVKHQGFERAIWWFPLHMVFFELLLGQQGLLGILANPLMSLGYTQSAGPLMPYGVLIGVAGISLCTHLMNVLVFQVMVNKKALAMLPILALFAGGIWAHHLVKEQTQHPTFHSLAYVQVPDLDIYKVRPGELTQQDRNRLVTLLGKLLSQAPQAELTVMPEMVIPEPINNPQLQDMIVRSWKIDHPVVFGAASSVLSFQFNSAVVYLPRTREFQVVYDKQQLVPFAEASFVRGNKPSVQQVGPMKVAFGICSENEFAAFARQATLEGAEALVFMSSDVFAGHSVLGAVHTNLSRFRAMESGRAVVHVSKPGPSAIFLPDGSVLATSDSFVAAQIQQQVPFYQHQNFYVRWGHALAPIVMVLEICWLLLVGLLFRKLPQPLRKQVQV